MTTKIWSVLTLCTLGSAASAFGAAAEPPIKGAIVQEISTAWNLRAEIQRLTGQQKGPFWIGYEVPLVPVMNGLCCLSGSCSLEKESEQMLQGEASPDTPQPNLMVFVRVHQGKVAQVRSFTTDCPLDAGGSPLFWVRNVQPKDSIALLGSVVSPQTFDTMAFEAIYAIGAHADRAADEALKAILRTAKSPEVREETLTRLGNVRGRAGLEVMRALWEGEENATIRRQLLVAIAESREPEAEDVLRQAAREDRDAWVRSWALMQVAQKGRRALPILSDAVAHDPDPEVRSAAVGALNFLPQEDKEEGREILKELARQNADPAIRRQAQSMLDWMAGCRPGKPDHQPQACSSR